MSEDKVRMLKLEELFAKIEKNKERKDAFEQLNGFKFAVVTKVEEVP